MSAADFSQLTAIIPAANRPKSLRRLVKSLRAQYPQLKVLVADSSREPKVPKQADAVKVPPAIGRASCCNALLAHVRTPYFLLLDERAELTPNTSLENLLDLVSEDKLDLAAGDYLGCRRRLWFFVKRTPQPAHGLLEFAGDQLTLQSGHRTIGEGYAWCDMVHNFYVARTAKIRNLGGWDPELQDDERTELFVRGQRQGLRVGLAPEVVANLWDEPAEVDEPLPDRTSLAVAKMGLSSMTTADGQVFKAPRRSMAA